MTLTEYLQNAVTELRASSTRTVASTMRTWTSSDPDASFAVLRAARAREDAALADHVEQMLRIYRYTPDCPSLRSVAELVAAVTGREMPQPQEDGWTPFQDDQGRTWYRRHHA